MKYIETERSFYKELIRIALPVALQNVITTGVNLMDTIMLGQLGETALSASSLANQFITLFLFLCMGISMGASDLTSRYWGPKDLGSLKKAVTITLRFGIILALVFTIANIAVPRKIMTMYTKDLDVIDAGTSYLLWSSVTYLLVGLSTVLTNIMRSVDLPYIPFISAISAFDYVVYCNSSRCLRRTCFSLVGFPGFHLSPFRPEHKSDLVHHPFAQWKMDQKNPQ